MTHGPRLFLALAMLCTGFARADVVNYQGRLTVDKVPYSGVGDFRFEVIDGQGAVSWSSGDVRLSVNEGRYAVRLGETAGSPPIGPALGQGPGTPSLRVWFRRDGLAWGIAGSDVPLNLRSPAPAALVGAGTDTEILAELRAIRTLLAGGAQCGGNAPPSPAPPPISMPMPDAPSLGRVDAPLVLVEFLDYQCPYCVKFHNEIYPQIKTAFVDSGKMRISSVQLPLPFHNFADGAARAAVCADAQGKFWEMREKLFAAGGTLPAETLRKSAQESGLNIDAFLACSGLEATGESVKKGIAAAKSAGIEATPSFVLGRVSGGKITGVKIVGAMPYATFAAEINKQLESQN